MWLFQSTDSPKNEVSCTCIIEERFNDGAVLEERTDGAHVLKVTALKGGVDERHRLKLHANEPEIKDRTGQDTTNQLNEQRSTTSNVKILMRKNQDQLNLTFATNKEIISNKNQNWNLFYISIAFLN